MKLKRGAFKKEIEIEKGEWQFVSVSCREGSKISIDTYEVDGKNFDIYLLRDADVKTPPLLPIVTDWSSERAVWSKKKISKVKKTYTTKERDKFFVFFDNRYARADYIYVDIDMRVEHPTLVVGDEPLRESIEVDARDFETIDVDAKSGDTIRVFGRVTKGNDITVHVLSKIYATPDTVHFDKAYWTTEKAAEIDAEYLCSKTEPLLIVFNNNYSRLTTKTVDVSVQVIRGAAVASPGKGVCPFCSVKIDTGLSFCPHCGGKL
jgi:hypothetical protein